MRKERKNVLKKKQKKIKVIKGRQPNAWNVWQKMGGTLVEYKRIQKKVRKEIAALQENTDAK